VLSYPDYVFGLVLSGAEPATHAPVPGADLTSMTPPSKRFPEEKH
jgi:hypothetical protein